MARAVFFYQKLRAQHTGIVIIIVVAPEEVLSRHVALPNYTENCSLFCSPWILETVTIKTINKKALIITETFD